jgi:toxin CcdB
LRQFDVFRNPSLEARKVAPFLVMLSSHHLHGIDEIIVAPLVNDAAETVGGLEILVEIDGERLTLVISEMFSFTPTGQRTAIDNLAYLEDDIRRAVDRLFTGF